MNIYFKGIRVVNPLQKLDNSMNLWIKDGKIIHCSETDTLLDDLTEIIDSKKLICSPGFFDLHVHLREPGQEYKEDILTGTNAAANGGFTGICCMPNTTPTIDNPAVVELIRQKSYGLLTDVYIAASITQNREGKLLSPMLELSEHGVVLFTDDGSAVMNSEVMKRAFDYAASKDLLISQHCEDIGLTVHFSANDGEISSRLGLKGYPSVAEEIILSRDIMLSEYCGTRKYHASHISTKGSVELIRIAKNHGLRVTCEVTPHHFTLTEENLTLFDTNYKMNPPLRSLEDVKAILDGLSDGTIDCIASDHAPHALHEKEVEFESAPNGIVGLETALGLSITNLVNPGIINLNQFIEKISINPRKLLGLPDIIIMEGEKANLTIFSHDEEWIVNKKAFLSKSKNSPFDGFVLKGMPKFTINNNKLHICKL